jgi:hypothetical protein
MRIPAIWERVEESFVDTTDAAIVIYGSPGSLVSSNYILSSTRSQMAGILMADLEPFDGDYTNTLAASVVSTNDCFTFVNHRACWPGGILTFRTTVLPRQAMLRPEANGLPSGVSFRGWTAIQLREGDNLSCEGAVIEDNKIGPAGEEWIVTHIPHDGTPATGYA